MIGLALDRISIGLSFVFRFLACAIGKLVLQTRHFVLLSRDLIAKLTVGRAEIVIEVGVGHALKGAIVRSAKATVRNVGIRVRRIGWRGRRSRCVGSPGKAGSLRENKQRHQPCTQ